ncbi:MAG: succinylglutamate desuccinylase/aspartoacylase family protein, partial [Acidobacteria bacterium]|nr:succinylglutamate desuccinylase/aspartoacylase family protein [Acidobacteriota bacterium]
PRGSLAGRLAHLVMSEIIAQCNHGVDLHTGSLHRTNLPQIRGNLRFPGVRELADAFGAPLLYDAPGVRGSLRSAALRRGLPVIVYEAGEPLRFNRRAIDIGVRGVLRVLTALGMWPRGEHSVELPPPFETSRTRWLRANQSGIFYLDVDLGEHVQRNQVLGHIGDPFSSKRRTVRAPSSGLVIGFTNNPLVHQGDALLHLALEG